MKVAPRLGCNGMGMIDKCLATILSPTVTVVSKLRFENSLELAYSIQARSTVKLGPGWALAQSIKLM